MPYDVTLRQLAPTLAMTLRLTTDLRAVGNDITKGYDELRVFLQENQGRAGKERFALYHGDIFNPDHIDVELCLSVQELLPGDGRIEGRRIEGGLMASTIHKGPHNSKEPAYLAIDRWIKDKDYLPQPLVREIYLNDPLSTPPEEYLTDILWSIKMG
jgi:effector-binding domain-containing protein